MRKILSLLLIVSGICLAGLAFWQNQQSKPAKIQVEFLEADVLQNVKAFHEVSTQMRITNQGATLARLVGTNAC